MINLKDIPRLPQRQDSLAEQLEDLHEVANRLGMYDAATYLRQLLEISALAQIHAEYNEREEDDGEGD